MLLMRPLLLSLVCALPLGAASVAAPVVADATVDPAQLSEPAARKGTRNYRPGEDATVPADAAAAKDDTMSVKDKLSQCMDTWDKGTHISKGKWREICQRQLSDQ